MSLGRFPGFLRYGSSGTSTRKSYIGTINGRDFTSSRIELEQLGKNPQDQEVVLAESMILARLGIPDLPFAHDSFDYAIREQDGFLYAFPA